MCGLVLGVAAIVVLHWVLYRLYEGLYLAAEREYYLSRCNSGEEGCDSEAGSPVAGIPGSAAQH